MEDEDVGIEALWQRVVAAQSGRYFLLKWMVVLGCARGLGMALSFAQIKMPPRTATSVWIVAWAVSAALSGGAEGWLIFGRRWRTLAWAAIPLAGMLSFLAGTPGRLFGFLNVGQWLLPLVFQILLLRSIRKQPVWWIAPMLVSMVASISAPFWNSAIHALTSQLGLSPQFSAYFIYGSILGSIHLASTGATLAWLMPPVVAETEFPARQPADSSPS